jgi:hypothetical protein
MEQVSNSSIFDSGGVTYFNVLIRHTDVICVCCQVLWCGHDSELYSALISKCLVCPFSDTADLLDCRNTIVRNKHLSRSMCQLVRLKDTIGISFSMKSILLTFVMTV